MDPLGCNTASDLLFELNDTENDSDLIRGSDSFLVFNQSALEYAHNGRFAGHLAAYIKSFINLEELKINQPPLTDG